MSADPMVAEAVRPANDAGADPVRDNPAARRALDAFLRSFLGGPGAAPDAGAALAASVPDRSFGAEPPRRRLAG